MPEESIYCVNYECQNKDKKYKIPEFELEEYET
jgi:hypothetical protein